MEHLEILLEYDYDIMGPTTASGIDFLLVSTSHCDYYFGNLHRLIIKVVDLGADVNYTDLRNRTALHGLLSNRRVIICDGLFGSIVTLLNAGAEMLHEDNFMCSCAPDGCVPTPAMEVDDVHLALVTLEILYTTEEHAAKLR